MLHFLHFYRSLLGHGKAILTFLSVLSCHIFNSLALPPISLSLSFFRLHIPLSFSLSPFSIYSQTPCFICVPSLSFSFTFLNLFSFFVLSLEFCLSFFSLPLSLHILLPSFLKLNCLSSSSLSLCLFNFPSSSLLLYLSLLCMGKPEIPVINICFPFSFF